MPKIREWSGVSKRASFPGGIMVSSFTSQLFEFTRPNVRLDLPVPGLRMEFGEPRGKFLDLFWGKLRNCCLKLLYTHHKYYKSMCSRLA